MIVASRRCTTFKGNRPFFKTEVIIYLSDKASLIWKRGVIRAFPHQGSSLTERSSCCYFCWPSSFPSKLGWGSWGLPWKPAPSSHRRLPGLISCRVKKQAAAGVTQAWRWVSLGISCLLPITVSVWESWGRLEAEGQGSPQAPVLLQETSSRHIRRSQVLSSPSAKAKVT